MVGAGGTILDMPQLARQEVAPHQLPQLTMSRSSSRKPRCRLRYSMRLMSCRRYRRGESSMVAWAGSGQAGRRAGG